MQPFINLFSAYDFIPHGYCLSWRSGLLWLHVASDGFMALSYYAMPIALAYFVRQRKDFPYPWLIIVTVLFVVACGTTHLFSIITIWAPLYWLDGVVKAIAAVVSVSAALMMFKIIPRALMLRSPAQFEAEIHDRKLAESSLLKQKHFSEDIISSLPGIFYMLDNQGKFIRTNQQFLNVSGYSGDEIIGMDALDFFEGEDRNIIAQRIREVFENGHTEVEAGFIPKSRQKIPYLFTGHRTSIDEQVYLVGLGMDITKRKSYEDKINFMAYHDRLTELPSREMLYDCLSQTMFQVRRKQDRLALFFLDLDGFKAVNDNYGHEAGDEVLKMTANRLLACVRDGDTVARLGGDEFAIILSGIENTSDATSVAKKVIENISEPMLLPSGRKCVIGVSIGISIYPENGTEIDRLLNAADSAMYESKASGKNIYTFSKVQAHWDLDNHNWIVLGKSHLFGFPELDQDHLELAGILNNLNAAVSNNEPSEVTAGLLDELAEQIRSHFQNENRLMDQYGYSDNNVHKNEHQRLIDELGYLKDKFNAGGEMAVLFALREWLLKHIATSDKLLGDFILKQSVK